MVKLLTYWWWFERVFLREIYSHLPHAALVRCFTHKKRQKPVLSHPTHMPMNVTISYSSASRVLPETHFPVPLSLGLRSKCSSAPENSSPKSLRVIRRHQRGTEWDCVNVWCSPRIAARVTGTACARFRLKAAADDREAARRGSTGENTASVAFSDAPNSFLRPLPALTER